MTIPRVICIGEMLLDRLSSQPGKSLEQVKSWQDFPGGAPANTACALAKLGVPTAFIGCIGQDQPGELLVNLLNDSGVNCTGVQRHPTAPTRVVYRIRDELGNSKFAGFGGRDSADFADTHLQAEQLPVSLFKEAEFLVLGTLELAYPDSKKALYKAIKLAKLYKAIIFLDVNWEAMFWKDLDAATKTIQELVKQVDFLKLTDKEAGFIFGTVQLTAIIKSLDNAKGVFVTANERGCSYYLGGHEGKLPAFSVKAEDTTGAGDAFNAGIIHRLYYYGCQNLTEPEIAKEIVTYASAIGALTTTKAGAIAGLPTPAEIEAFLRSHCLEEDSSYNRNIEISGSS